MTKAEFDAMPGADSEHEAADSLRSAAKHERARASRSYHSCIGADVAEAPLHDISADALACVASGKDIDAVLSWAEGKWRRYAAAHNNGVAGADRIKDGPRRGQGVLDHRWASPEAWAIKESLIRCLAKRVD